MDTPCEWAEKAKNDKGQKFKLTALDSQKSTEATLVVVDEQTIGGGYEGFTFSWQGPAGGPSEDGMYGVSGGSAGDTELFLVVNEEPDGIHYVATITCKES